MHGDDPVLGRSFCFKDHLGSVYAAHISPDDPNQQGVGLPAGVAGNSGTRFARQLAGLEVGVAGYSPHVNANLPSPASCEPTESASPARLSQRFVNDHAKK